jgi:preprotein translocase subunit YajC
MISAHLMAQAVALPATLAQAPAGGAGGSAPGLFGNPLIFMGLMFVVMYFLLIRPQRLKQKQAELLQKAVQPGDEVVTIGGAHGIVTTVREKTIIVRVNEGKIEFDRAAIATRIPKEGKDAAIEAEVVK